MTQPDPMRPVGLDPQGRLIHADLLHRPALTRLLDVMNRDGEETRIIGGAVRNALLGLPPGDIDLATTATPETTIGLAKAARFRAIPTGLLHGTVTVVVDREPYEITTLREDVETDGRHAVVRFGRDFLADALRRDFTINALSLGADGVVHDLTGGIADLRAGRVRFIGEADRRVREDFLRILRFFRFHAAYGTGPLDPDGLAAAERHRDALARLSRERIRAELLKLLVAPRAPAVTDVMERVGILHLLLQGPTYPERLSRLSSFLRAQDQGPDPLLALAALAGDGPADAERLRDRLRLSNAEQKRIEAALTVRQAFRPDEAPTQGDLDTQLFLHGRIAAQDGVCLAAADADDAQPWAVALNRLQQMAEPKMPIGGAQVMERGIRDGRLVGAVLKAFQALWIRAGFPRDPAVLTDLLDRAILAAREEAGPVQDRGPASI